MNNALEIIGLFVVATLSVFAGNILFVLLLS
jgi:hypothetical protein